MHGISDSGWSWFTVSPCNSSGLRSVDVLVLLGWVKGKEFRFYHKICFACIPALLRADHWGKFYVIWHSRKWSVMKFGNISPYSCSWRCSSLWRQVALRSGEDPCCARGVCDSLLHEYHRSSFHMSYDLSRLPSDASCYASNSSIPSMRTARKGTLGLTSIIVQGEITGAWWEDTKALCERCPLQSLQRPFVFPTGKSGLLCRRLEISRQKV